MDIGYVIANQVGLCKFAAFSVRYYEKLVINIQLLTYIKINSNSRKYESG
jgi:hypothetical protein